MARKRLTTILASTVLATGLAAVPATAQSLGDLTDTVEDTVEQTTETVDEVVESTAEAVEEATGGVTGPTEAPSGDDTDTSGDEDDTAGDSSGDGGSTNVVEDTVEQATEAVEDTVEQVTRTVEETVGEATDQLAPDPAPSDQSDETETSSTSPKNSNDTGLVAGDGVVAAESNPSRNARNPQGTGSGTSLAEAIAAFGALGRSSGGGAGTSTGGSFATNDVSSPEVAGPDAPSFQALPDSQPVERPAVTTAGPVATTDPNAALLKVVAALLVLGTGVAATRAVERA